MHNLVINCEIINLDIAYKWVTACGKVTNKERKYGD